MSIAPLYPARTGQDKCTTAAHPTGCLRHPKTPEDTIQHGRVHRGGRRTACARRRQARQFEETDDAQIDGDISAVSPRVPGTVSAVHVVDHQEVKQGDLLVELDPTDLEVAVAQTRAAVAQAEAAYQAENRLNCVFVAERGGRGLHSATQGLPEAELPRAREILANLEAQELDEAGHPALAGRRHRVRAQLVLFEPATAAPAPPTAPTPSQVEEALRALDLSRTTPLDALLLLNEQQKKLR